MGVINTLKVEKVSLFENAEEIKKICNGIAINRLKDVGMTYEWITALWESHFGKEDCLTFLIRNENDEPIALLPFYKIRKTFGGIGLNIIKPFTGLYSIHGGIPILEREREVVETISEYLGKEEGWDSLEFCVEETSSIGEALGAIERKSNYCIVSNLYESSPFLAIDGSVEGFLSKRSQNFRSNLKRKEKKINEAGDFKVVLYENETEVKKALSEVFEIEERSWKVKEGSAIVSNKRRKEFYKKLAHRAAGAGWLRIYVAKLNNNPIGFDFGLYFGRRYYMLKTSYDEAYSKLSPGFVLRWHIVKDLFSKGALEHDFLWGAEKYKMEWASGCRKHRIICIYRNTPFVKLMLNIKKYVAKFRKK